MRLNENVVVCGNDVVLVPYEEHHVPRYHQWMEDAAIREATASERLTLAEEYSNQKSWRSASDKLTFIVCDPQTHRSGQSAVVAGEIDGPGRMVGDINLFLTPWEPDDEEGGQANGDARQTGAEAKTCCAAEVDVMIADPRHRGRGFGRAAVAAFLLFVHGNLDAILKEYAGAADGTTLQLREVVAKIGEGNAGSIALFRSLGFEQRGGVNYFGEIQMVFRGFGVERGEARGGPVWEAVLKCGERYREVGYDRSTLKEYI
ncbi:acetyltransferase domain-containing protein [Annulohypoxylon bovei var. microspora]|nr:acetyltransferase domain-containing protein [Annulohypoxylon bovei var. microspora]